LIGTGVKRGRVDRDEFERSGSAVRPYWYAPEKCSFLATDILSMGRAFGEIHARVRDTTGHRLAYGSRPLGGPIL
jgi:hypothetical protein